MSNTDDKLDINYIQSVLLYLNFNMAKLDMFCDPMVTKIKDKIMNLSTIVSLPDQLE